MAKRFFICVHLFIFILNNFSHYSLLVCSLVYLVWMIFFARFMKKKNKVSFTPRYYSQNDMNNQNLIKSISIKTKTMSHLKLMSPLKIDWLLKWMNGCASHRLRANVRSLACTYNAHVNIPTHSHITNRWK